MANLSDLIKVLSPTTSNYGEDTGTANNYVITLVPAPTSYENGVQYIFKATYANTGTSTLNVNSLGAKTIKKNGTDDLLANDIIADQMITVIYDGTNFQMISVTASQFKYHIVTNDFTLDVTDIGSDFGSAFSGMVSTVDFEPDIQGTAWAHVNFDNTGFDPNKDIYLDLHHLFDGTIGSDLTVRIQVRVWVVVNSGTPVLGTPTDDVTTDILIPHIDTNKVLESNSFLTVSNVDLTTSTDTVIISVTRLATHINDTFTGTYQLMNVFLRQ